MDDKKNNYFKWGIAFALSWNILIIGIYTIMCIINGVGFSENIEVDSWYGFYACYVMATLVWFYIGYGLRKEYITKKGMFVSSFSDISKSKTEEIFRLHFIKRYSKILTIVFVTAIPWYMIANVREDLRTKDIVYISIFMIVSTVLAYLTKSLSKRIEILMT